MKEMRHCVGFVAAAWVSVGCFVDTPSDDVPGTDGGRTSSAGGSTGGRDSDVDPSASSSGTGSPDTGDSTTSSSSGPATDTTGCPVGVLGCACDGELCNEGLSCIADECTRCGDGRVSGPEQCDGDVDGGQCVECLIVCDPGFDDCDFIAGNGCEIDLSSTTNCGACGRDCLGGECEDQSCQPVDLAQSQNQPLGLDVDGDFVFWTNLGAAFGDGGVFVHSTQPGGPPTPIATGLSFPETVVADGSKVYWADTFGTAPNGGIGQANYDGTGSIPQWRGAAQAAGTRLLVDSPSHIFALRFDTGAFRAPKVLPGFEQVATANAFGGFFDGTYLYWSDNGAGEIRRADVSGGPPYSTEVLVVDQPLAYAVYVHGDVVYWTTDGDDGGANGTVRSRTIAGGRILEFAADVDQPEDLVVDETHVYWVEWEAGGRVERAEHDGSNRVVLATAFSAGIAQDDTAIYWVDQTGGRIRKLAK